MALMAEGRIYNSASAIEDSMVPQNTIYIELPLDPAIALLSTYPKEMKPETERDL